MVRWAMEVAGAAPGAIPVVRRKTTRSEDAANLLADVGSTFGNAPQGKLRPTMGMNWSG